MNELNQQLLEEYKRLDQLCRDMFRSTDGVSEYIRQMDAVFFLDRRYSDQWQSDYDHLKHIRHIRNQIAHEVGTMDMDLCTDEDIDWIAAFHQRILSREDSLALIRCAKEQIARERRAREQQLKKQRAEQQKAQAAQQTTQHAAQPQISSAEKADSDPQKNASLWDKIKSFFRSIRGAN